MGGSRRSSVALSSPMTMAPVPSQGSFTRRSFHFTPPSVRPVVRAMSSRSTLPYRAPGVLSYRAPTRRTLFRRARRLSVRGSVRSTGMPRNSVRSSRMRLSARRSRVRSFRRPVRRFAFRRRRPSMYNRRAKRMTPFNRGPFTIGRFLSSGGELPRQTFVRMRYRYSDLVTFNNVPSTQLERCFVLNSINDFWRNTDAGGTGWFYKSTFQSFYKHTNQQTSDEYDYGQPEHAA